MKKTALTILIAATTSGALAKEPRFELDSCIESAAQYHRVNAKTLKAIVFQESSGKPWKTNRNTNNTVDYGASGINSIHLPELAKFGITERHLMNGCINVFVGAWKYSKKVAKHGNTWEAVGAYHSETPRFRDSYSLRIRTHLVNWGLLPRSELAASPPAQKHGLTSSPP